MRILLVDDDEALMKSLAERLIQQRYAVDIAVDGKSGQTYVELFDYDLIVLDLVLPDGDGIHFCQQFRQGGYSNPLMILTAKESTSQKVKALDAGADDYVIKPFNFDELCARIRALLRRESHGLPTVLHWGALSLDPSSLETTYSHQPVRLTPKEFSMMELFMRNPHRVYSLGSIMDDLWSYEDSPGEDAIRTHIKGLRRKLEAAGAPKDLIKTVYGLGYRLNENTTQTSRKEASQKRDKSQRLNQQASGTTKSTPKNAADKRMAKSPVTTRLSGLGPHGHPEDAIAARYQKTERETGRDIEDPETAEHAGGDTAPVSVESEAAWSQSWGGMPLRLTDPTAGVPVWQAYSTRRQNPIGEQPLPGKIAIACKNYLRTASQQIAVLEEATLALSNGTLAANLHHTSQLNAHKLAGSLGSFGISQGSEIARTLETQLRARSIFAASAPSHQEAGPESTAIDAPDVEPPDVELPDVEKAVVLLPAASLVGLVQQLRYSIEQATVQTISQALSTVVQESTPLLLIVSSDDVLSTRLSQAVGAHQLRTQVVRTPEQAMLHLNTAAVTPELVLLDCGEETAAENAACDRLIEKIKHEHELPVVVLTNLLTLDRRLSLVNRGVEMVSDRTTAPPEIIGNAAGILKDSMGNVRVAIADDDPQMLALLKVGLEPWGFSVHTFSSALELWQWLTVPQPFPSAGPPTLASGPVASGFASSRLSPMVASKADILVLDVEMPKMNGLELCRVLRADARFQNLPILFLTIHQEEALRRQAFQSGADDFIDKTVAPIELATRLRNQLARACRL